MNLPRLILCSLGALLVCTQAVHAQYEMKSGVYNRLSQRVPANNSAHIPPIGANQSPTGDPTITPQFSNVVESTSSSAHKSDGGVPQNPAVKLTLSSAGTTFASGVPRYFYGDRITPPASIISQAGATLDTSAAGYWRAEPVRPGEVLANPNGSTPSDYRTGEASALPALTAPTLENFYYSPHARAVFANTPGTVEITWRSSVPDASHKYIFYKERFSVSSATATPVRSMYWTEKSFNGPRVSIPSGKIVTVNPVYSNVFTETVATEYVVVGASAADPNAEGSEILRTLWFEKNNGVGELHAYNLTGRILVEYLGELQQDGTHTFLGLDIVNVDRSLPAVTATISLGEPIIPYGELPAGGTGFNTDESLVGSPVQTTSGVGQVTYYGTNPRPDGTLEYYAERENDIEDRVTFYWLEPLPFSLPETGADVANVKIQWPKYLNKYLQVWPTDVASFAVNRLDVNGSSSATGTGLPFLGGNIPQIIYQDSTQGDASVDSATQMLLVNLSGEADGQNRVLLKFTGSNGGVWYVRLLSAASNQMMYGTYNLGATTATAYVGERLTPPSSDLTAAGYIASGTSYSPNAYINPFISGVSAAAQGAIIPVNAVPGQNTLTVWWFKKTPARSGEFSDLYTPAQISTYTLAHRESTTVVSENFDSGATGWTENTTTTLSGTNKYLGAYGSYAVGTSNNASTSGPASSKTFTISGVDEGGLEIAFRLMRFDTWDSEIFRAYVNGRLVLERTFALSAVTTDATGTTTVSDVKYDWTVTRDSAGYTQLNGVSTSDQFFNVSIRATPLTQTGLESLAALTVGFGSNLNQPANDESFGIDDLYIRLPVPEIVLASNNGTGLLPDGVADYAIYNQPDPAQVGYNPNEEHALLEGGRGYALRDDLNVTSGTGFTSMPRVLISYTDPADNRPAMKVYQVLRENQLHTFDYAVTAGTQLNVLAPMPLPRLPLPIRSDGSVANLEVDPAVSGQDLPVGTGAPASYKSFTFRDRKGYDWVYRGPHAGTSSTAMLCMKFYYSMRADFSVPGRTVAAGTILPYLRPIAGTTPSTTYSGDAVSGDALTVVFRPVWPSSSPELNVGETLALPKNFLPAVRGQTSAQVLYQQSIANEGSSKPSATLHDPTRIKSVLINAAGVGLTALPPSLSTTSQNGKTYFQLAQPHLQQRIWFNPNLGDKGGIELTGQFVDEIAGEDYLLLNTLSPQDVSALKGLVQSGAEGKSGWDAAIDKLSTTVETFKENPSKPGTYIADSTKTVVVNGTTLVEVSDSDTAVDSYALTAKGQGQGYVTLIFGDGEAFTPQGEPVSVAIIRVGSELYTGDLKAILASNPLDEQASLRHSGDYAARPDLYDFEWAYFTTADGGFPPIYTYSTQMVLGTGTNPATNSWSLLGNPAADLNESTNGQSYTGATTVTLSRSMIINEAGYDNNNPKKYPAGKILKSTSLNFTREVPEQIILSAASGDNNGDGFVVYVNHAPVLAYNLPATSAVPGNLPLSSAVTGLVSTEPAAGGLDYQFQLPPTAFAVGVNTLEIALYSAQTNASAGHLVDFRVHALVKTDGVVAGTSQWKVVPPPTSPLPPLLNTIVVGGSAASPLGNPLLLFSDNYFTVRYKAKDPAAIVSGSAYSEWSNPVLVESWVKRVLDGINPFNQRQTDLYNNPVSTDVSILTQAGKRWEGDVALNLSNINSFGLIEIYETVLNRVKAQSIDAGIDDASVNNTLLLAAGYLNDLYVTLGNEAYDDAVNPTIQIDGQAASSDVSSARFSFEGQMGTLIQETLGLLRGRDDFTSPGTRTTPAYNRMYWNYTNGINSGEPIYAVNYNVKEKAGGPYADGVLDASDAQYMFPQGHGDAYGHYLTALTGYYKLLTNANFTWAPSTEAVTVLGQAVQVDYKDERKFAAAAAALARAGREIIDFTARDNHLDGEEHGWTHHGDGKPNSATNTTRNWGTDEWSSRVYQGAYFNWISANAMLPAASNKEGIEKIDRTTVPELNEIVTAANDVLTLSSGLQAHLNTLGLPHDAMTFDISPQELAAGKSHFEQIYERAVQSSVNAKNAFHQAGLMNQLLRQQNDSQDDYNAALSRQESAYEYDLSTIFGTPYPGDIGPGKLYEQGYAGPDFYHYFFIDLPSALVDTSEAVTVNFREPINHDPVTDWSIENIFNRVNDPVQYTTRSYTISPFSLGQFTPADYGKRSQPGKLQAALLDAYQAQVNLREATNSFNDKKARFDRAYQLYSELIADYKAANAASDSLKSRAGDYANAATLLTQAAGQASAAADYASQLAAAVSEGIPTVTGPFAFDTAFVGRGIAKLQGAVAAYAEDLLGLVSDTAAAKLEGMAADLEAEAQALIDDVSTSASDKKQVLEFERLYHDMLATSYEMNRRLSELQKTTDEVSRLLAQANHILSDRETFRLRAASVIQGYRTRDVVYRDLRNEELSQYKSLFDLAQTYVYCAAKAYDYETGLLSSEDGESFVNDIIGTYSLGDFNANTPVASGLGDRGLAGILADLNDEWLIVEGRLGINNPDRNGTVFSLRQELFRIPTDQPTADDNTIWKQVLQQHVMSNVMNDPDVATYCNNLIKPDGTSVPGIVIPFATTIQPGQNFFGWPLAGGDHTYSQSNFATKIHSVGLVFKGYIGMDPYAQGTPGAAGPASSNPNALSATPYAYLIPAGVDHLLAPPLGDTNIVRSWSVKDQALPLPKNLGTTAFSSQQFFSAQGTLNENLWIVRKHQAFRAVDDPVYFYGSVPAEYTNSRLISRSVWNSQWKIVIPAYYLLNDEQAGLDRFIRSVTDIKLFLRTYSTSGN